MRSDKFKAYKLRIKGRSYSEISKLLNVPKSTLSAWFSSLVLSDESQSRIKERVIEGSLKGLLRRNRIQTHYAELNAKEIRESARKEIVQINPEALFIAGISLYWAEGYKRPIVKNGRPRTYHPVRLMNSDPLLISLFLRFIRESCKIPEEKIKISLRFFEHQNEAYLLDFWQKSTKIPISRFDKSYKSVSISSQRKRPFNILPYGTVQISINSTNLYHRIMGWIEGLQINI